MKTFFLTQADAEKRAQAFSSAPEYQVYLKLNKGEEYHGVIMVSFSLSSKQNIFLDFNGKKVRSATLNEFSWSEEELEANVKSGKITLPEAQLVEGPNALTVTFENVYSHDGNGLHSFTDQDGSQYGYCQTEPYACNRIFPLFDQPDLKGTLTFLISAPKDWTILANTPVSVSALSSEFNTDHLLFKAAKANFEADFDQTEFSTHLFGKVPHISSYLYAFIFGHFLEIKNTDSDTVPMSIFCRASMLKYCKEQASQIFAYPKEGIRWYEQFFQTKYPFEKFDMVFCPEYTMGAMEYPGLITFNDNLITRDTPTVVQASRLGKVILHELAHMWFGNLVTLKWWNDLWLNESFADFACYLCGYEIRDTIGFPIADSMTTFCIRKSWGYNEDQAVTTHPIACEVVNTSKAESIFDGITYAKGAAVLKQLYFLLGKETFSNNLGSYFAKYAWKNATLKDFLSELAKNSTEDPHQNLEQWNKTWIETAGLNVIETQWKEGSQDIIFKQSSALKEHDTLRIHKIKVGYYNHNCEVVKVDEVFVEAQAETLHKTEAKDFVAVLPNYEDWDFVRISFDPVSAEFFRKNLNKLDQLNKLVVIRGFFEMVRDAQMKATDFIESLTDNLLSYQTDQVTLQIVLDCISEASTFMPRDISKTTMRKVFDLILHQLRSENDPDKVRILRSSLIRSANCEESYHVLQALLEEAHHELKLEFNTREKWSIIVKIFKSEKVSALKKSMLRSYFASLDKSDLKKSYGFTLDAIAATSEEMKQLWENEYISPDRKMSFQDIDYSLSGFYTNKSKELKEEYFLRFFADYPIVANRDSKEFGKEFFQGLLSSHDYNRAVSMLEEMIGKLDESQEFHRIAVRKRIDFIKRVIKAHSLYK